MFTGIRQRLLAYYLVGIAVIVILMGGFFIWFLEYFYLQGLQDSLINQARLAAVLIDDVLSRDTGPDDLEPLFAELGTELGLRLTLVAPDGTVLADSDEDPLLMNNHRERPEIKEAMLSGRGVSTRYSATLDQDMYYLATYLQSGPAEPDWTGTPAVVRLAMPLEDIKGAITTLVFYILSALFLSSLFALGAAALLSKSITGPINRIGSAAQAIAGGNFSPQLDVGGRDELAVLAGNIKDMGSSLEERMDQVVHEKNKLEAVVFSMSNGVILVDRNLNVELINPAAEELFDLTGIAVVGRPFKEAIRHYALNENLKDVCRQGEFKMTEISLYYPRAAVLDIMIIPVRGSEEEVSGALLVFQETTGRRSIEKMRSDFVANVSHELRTPLTTVRGYTETILHENLSREQLIDFLQIIDRETGRLSSLLDDLLDLARIENEKGYVKKEQVNLSALLEEAIATTENLRIDREAEISFDFPPEPVYTAAHPSWLRQALVNVLENSLRHGIAKGKVTVRLQAEGGRASVEIEDNGPGIPEADLPYLFERFYRVDKARSRKSGGTGLGLSIVKHILEAHDANYMVRSRPGEGTVFRITLPLDLA